MTTPVSLPSVVLLTGTGPGVGVTTAAAALIRAVWHRTSCRYVKVVQTGVAEWEQGDVDRLEPLLASGAETVELTRLRPDLDPASAATATGIHLPRVSTVARTLTQLEPPVQVTLVEGCGAPLTRLDDRGGTLLDLATALKYKGVSVGVVLCTRATRADLGVTALIEEAVRHRSLGLLGIVVTQWPSAPTASDLAVAEELPIVAGAPVLGRIPELTEPFAEAVSRRGREWMEIE